jgi:hypothetical protein
MFAGNVAGDCTSRSSWAQRGLPPSASPSSEEKLLTDSIIRAVEVKNTTKEGRTYEHGSKGHSTQWRTEVRGQLAKGQKATLTLLLLSLMLWAGYAMGMEYAYALGRAGHNEAALALGLAGVFVCAPFTFLASAACGVAGAL